MSSIRQGARRLQKAQRPKRQGKDSSGVRGQAKRDAKGHSKNIKEKKMVKVNKAPEDRKKEIEAVKKEESAKKTMFGQEVAPQFQGGKEKPANTK